MGRVRRPTIGLPLRLTFAAVVVAGCAGRSPVATTTGRQPTTTTSARLASPAVAPTTTGPAGASVPSSVPSVPSSVRPTAAPSTPATSSTVHLAAPTRPSPTAPPARTTVVTAKPGCPTALAGQLAATGGGSQVVTAEAPSAGVTVATVTLWQRAGSCWAVAGGPWPARVGYNGLSSRHREGDGTTPMGVFGISSSFYGIAGDPGVHGAYHQLVCGDWWDEDPTSPKYNTFQHVACGTTPAFGGQSEELWKTTTAYQHFAVVQYNTGPVVAGGGSGIFIHDDTGAGTNGCISLAPGNLNSLLRWLQPGQSPHIVIGTSGNIGQF